MGRCTINEWVVSDLLFSDLFRIWRVILMFWTQLQSTLFDIVS